MLGQKLKTLLFDCTLAFILINSLAYGQAVVLNPGDGPDIYLDWDDGGDPESPIDFVVTFTSEDYPNMELKEENEGQSPILRTSVFSVACARSQCRD